MVPTILPGIRLIDLGNFKSLYLSILNKDNISFPFLGNCYLYCSKIVEGRVEEHERTNGGQFHLNSGGTAVFLSKLYPTMCDKQIPLFLVACINIATETD